MSSQDPGQLGIYGFRNRKDHSYDGLSFALSSAVKVPRLWEILSQHDKRSVILGVPQTYPPPKQLNGLLVSSFLTPSKRNRFTYPEGLQPRLERLAGEGGYMIDVPQFRTDDKERLLHDIYEMTRRRMRVVKALLSDEAWDLFAFVEMGPDRLHHGFWRYCSATHRLFEPGNRYEHVIRDYYAYLDRELAEILARVDDDVAVLVVSDHGAQDMVGGICINEFLIAQGWLTLKAGVPSEPTKVTPDMIDWSQTKAWGEGGYYGRLFLNVRGREPDGQVAPEDVDAFRDEVQQALEGICDPDGRNIGTVVHRPSDVYREVRNIAPDLMVFFGNLTWRSVGSVGMGGIHTLSNDTGPDDANHAQDGVFAMRAPGGEGKEIEGLSLYDVAPTALKQLGVPVPSAMIGTPVG